MVRTAETGHTMNVANFGFIVSDAAAYGTTYNPSKASLKVTALNTLLTSCKNALNAESTTQRALDLATDAREVAFKQLSPVVTRVIRALKATDVTAEVEKTAQSLVRLVQGRRATPKKTEEQMKAAADAGKVIVEISASHMGFELRADNFEKLIKLLTAVPSYAPNEAELKVSALTAQLNDLKAKNAAIAAAKIAQNNARITRDDVMYKPDAGMVDIASDIKNYIMSVFGAQSPQYKKISGIRFSKPRKA